MEAIIAASQGCLSKIRTGSSIALSVSLALAGVLIVVAAALFVGPESTTTSLCLNFLGGALVLVFGFKLIFSAGSLVHTPTKSKVKPYTVFFKAEELTNLMHAIESQKPDLLPRMAGGPGSGLRLDVLLSQDDQFAACQLMRYVPHHYEEASPVYTIGEDHLASFCNHVRTLHNKQLED